MALWKELDSFVFHFFKGGDEPRERGLQDKWPCSALAVAVDKLSVHALERLPTATAKKF